MYGSVIQTEKAHKKKAHTKISLHEKSTYPVNILYPLVTCVHETKYLSNAIE